MNANLQPAAEALSGQFALLQRKLDAFRKSSDGSPQTLVLVEELETAQEELRVADEEVRAQQQEIERLVDLKRNAEWARERLIAVMPAPVVVTDQRGTVKVANAMAAGLFCLPVDRLVGKPLFAYVDEDDRRRLRTMLGTATRELTDFRTFLTLHPRTKVSTSASVAATVRQVETVGVEVTWALLPSDEGASAPPQLAGATLARALVDLTRAPLESREPRQILGGIAADCEHAFEFRVEASVTLGPPTDPEFVASSSERAQELDGAQVMAGEGPCQTAWQSGKTVVTPDLRTDVRWPGLAARGHVAVPTAAVGVPVIVGDEVVGALNIYSTSAELTHDTAVESAELLAATVAAVLHETRARAELESLSANLRKALESRALIDQAKGMVMLQRGCSSQEAFEILAKMSSDQNVKLRTLAARMVQRVGGEHGRET